MSRLLKKNVRGGKKHWEMKDNLIHKANLSNIGIRMVVNVKILVSYRRLEVQ